MSSLYSGILPIIKQAALDAVNSTQPVNILFGKVIKTSPLNIQVSPKLILGEGNLVVPDSLSKKSYQISIDGTTGKAGGGSEHDHEFESDKFTFSYDGTTAGGDTFTITKEFKIEGTTEESGKTDSHSHTFSDTVNLVIDNSLKVGDSVILARIQGGSSYLVLDKAVST